MLTLPEIAGSRYLLYRGLCDAGFSAGRAALAVDVLLGPEPAEEPEPEPEPYEPSEEDWADYREYCEEYEDRMWGLRIEADEPHSISDRDVLTVLGCVG